MLVLFYAPDLTEDFSKFISTFTETRYFVLSMIMADRNNSNEEERSRIVVRMGAEFSAFEEACKVVRSKLITRAKALL